MNKDKLIQKMMDSWPEKPGWIKAEDKLPEINQPVFAYIDGLKDPCLLQRCEITESGLTFPVWCRVTNIPFINLQNRWEADSEYDDYYVVTHWHPLPELINEPNQ